MRELIKIIIILSFLMSVLYAIYGIIARIDYNAYLVVGPIVIGIILLLLMNFLFRERGNTWIRERKDEE